MVSSFRGEKKLLSILCSILTFVFEMVIININNNIFRRPRERVHGHAVRVAQPALHVSEPARDRYDL